MKGELHLFSREGRSCACLVPEGSGPFPFLLLCGWGMEKTLPRLGESLPPVALLFVEAQGDRDFTPWPAPGIREGELFSGGGKAYLEFLLEEILPYGQREFSLSSDPCQRGILGYSLGGLFALWAQSQGDIFQVAGSLSGSLWYPGWMGYLFTHPPRREEKIYLSLGDREERGGPPALRRVGDCTRLAHGFYEAQGIETILEWNRGGHGKGVENRWKKALAWAAPRVVRPWIWEGSGKA